MKIETQCFFPYLLFMLLNNFMLHFNTLYRSDSDRNGRQKEGDCIVFIHPQLKIL